MSFTRKGKPAKARNLMPKEFVAPLTLYSILLNLMLQQQTALENIVGKGEIAGNEQFLLFPQCFQLG